MMVRQAHHEGLEALLVAHVPDFGTMYAVGGRQSLSRSLTIYMDSVNARPFPTVATLCDVLWERPAGAYELMAYQRTIVHIEDRAAKLAVAA